MNRKELFLFLVFIMIVIPVLANVAFSAEKNPEIGPGEVGQILVFQRGYGDECFWFVQIKEYPVFVLEQKKEYTLLRRPLTAAERRYAEREYWPAENSAHEKWIYPHQIGEQE